MLVAGGSAAPLQAVTDGAGTRIGTRGRGGERPDRLDPAAVVDEQAAALGEDRARRRSGPGEQRRLGEGLRLERGGAERGGADQAGPGRLAGRRVEQVVGVAAVGASRQIRTLRPEVATAPQPSSSTWARSPVSGCSTKTS